MYEYIGHYWKFGFDDLWAANFDLEECFTLLEQHEKEAERPMNTTEADNVEANASILAVSISATLAHRITDSRAGSASTK